MRSRLPPGGIGQQCTVAVMEEEEEEEEDEEVVEEEVERSASENGGTGESAGGHSGRRECAAAAAAAAAAGVVGGEGGQVRGARIIFIDWLRVIAVLLVVCVHATVSSLQTTGTLDEVQRLKVRGSIRMLLQFLMPLLFYCSGRSAAFSNASLVRFVWQRAVRLLLPLAIGLVLIVVPTMYIGREHRPCASATIDNFWLYFDDYFRTQIGCNGVDWYWFLPVLFIISALNQYKLLWFKSRHRNGERLMWRGGGGSDSGSGGSSSKNDNDDDDDDRARPPLRCDGLTIHRDLGPLLYGATVVGGLAGTAAAIRMPVQLVIVALAPYLVLSPLFVLPHRSRRAVLPVVFALAPLSSITLATLVREVYTDGGFFDNVSLTVLSIFFHNLFYLQGYLDQLLDREWEMHWDAAASGPWSATRPIRVMLLMLALCLGTPTTPDSGYLYNFPAYKGSPALCAMYVAGAWAALALWLCLAKAHINNTFIAPLYRLATASSMFVYLTHWLFIEMAVTWIVVPNKDRFSFVSGMLVGLVAAAAGCTASFALRELAFAAARRAFAAVKRACCGE